MASGLRRVSRGLRSRAQGVAGRAATGLARIAPASAAAPRSLPPPRQVPYPADVSDASALRRVLAETDAFGGLAREAEDYLTVALERFRVTMAILPELGAGASVLELGAHPYFLTRLLRQRGHKVRCANWFGEEYHGEGVSVHHVTESGVAQVYGFDHFNVERDRFPYDDASFDLVLFCEIMEHLPCDPTQTLAEIHRVLKPGGTMLLTTPNASRLENLVKVQRGENMYEELSGYGVYGRHNREYTIAELGDLLTGCGYVIDDVFAVDVWLDPEPPVFAPGMALENRGENIFLLARPTGQQRWYYPGWLYQSAHGYRRPVRPDLLVGTNCDLQATGLHALEELAGRPGRWTDGSTETRITLVASADGPARLEIHGHSPGLGGNMDLYADVAGTRLTWTVPCDGEAFVVGDEIEVAAGSHSVALSTNRPWQPALVEGTTDDRTLGFVLHGAAFCNVAPDTWPAPKANELRAGGAPVVARSDERARQLQEQPAWIQPGHFYSPIPDVAEVVADAERVWPADPNVLPAVDLGLSRQRILLDHIAPFYADMPFEEDSVPGLRYRLKNDFFAYTNGVFAYLLLRHLRPQRYVEVGSGFSSALALDVNDLFFNGSMQCTFIEPYPTRLHELLTPEDQARVVIHEQRVQDVDVSVFQQLDAGDVLFIDSTHVSRVGSDVNHLVFDVLPRLRPGVIVHVHDVFAGFEYPRCWIEEGRAWSESYVLRAFLQYNESFEILLWDAALIAAGDNLEERFPKARNGIVGSIWLRRVR